MNIRVGPVPGAFSNDSALRSISAVTCTKLPGPGNNTLNTASQACCTCANSSDSKNDMAPEATKCYQPTRIQAACYW